MTNGEENPSSESDLGPNRAGTHDPPDSETRDQQVEINSGEIVTTGGETVADLNEGSITSELAWVGRGFFQPLYSLQFYRAAVHKSLIDAILFFVVFGTLLTIISAINLSRNLSSAADDIEQAFASGEFPEITITNGLATVRARQPLILLEGEGSMVIIDTSGAYQTIDTSRYIQGFLLTRNSLHVYSNGDYQVVQLADLNSAFGNPIVINRETALNIWSSFTSILSVAAFIGIGLWNLVIRMMWIAFLAVLVWGGLSAFNLRSDYGSVLTMGIYALVPAVYLSFLLGLIGISFCGFQTGLLLLIWVVVARMALKPPASVPAQL